MQVLKTGFFNPLDEAIRSSPGIDISAYTKIDEVPYDFIRKRLSVVVNENSMHIMITKGALDNILKVCTSVETSNEEKKMINDELKASIKTQYENFCSQGYRSIAVCYKDVSDDPVINKDDETEMCFLGLLVLSDSPKSGIIDSINRLKDTGIALKIITGDNHLVAAHVASAIGSGLKEH
jgi:Mg2+-importing ATPase